MSFVHLHVHSEYSLLDGFSNINKLVNRVKELDMPAVALTDHGTMFGIIEFYNAARKAGIKPILGLEAYLSERRMTDRDSKLDKKSSHLLLLAENETGYRNLLKIASAAQMEGFYYVPRIDREYLAAHAEGLICTTGCLAAEVPRLIMDQGADAARTRLDWYYEVFGDDRFFLELQEHNIPELDNVNKALLSLGPRYQANFVATNDSHYINPEDARLQDILLSVQTGALLADPNRFRMSGDSYHLRTPQEMQSIFASIPQALSNTLLIAERCQVDLTPKGYHLPKFEVPDGFTAETYLRKLCEEGLQKRYGEQATDPEVRQRLDYELKIINDMGFNTYFLIVWDLCRYASEQGIWYDARGSAGGSMVAYVLEITLVEPLRYGLFFERFLNPDRITMPDIDLDFQDDRRAQIMEYCAQKYGDDKVAQIITFGTMGARGAIRDVGRVMDIPLSEVDRITKLVPQNPAKPLTLEEAVEQVPELKAAVSEAGYLRELVDTAARMEGAVRNAGTHAAGVIITDEPIVNMVPIHRPTSGAEESPIKTVTQFDMNVLDSLKLLKIDFLGLATLTIMARATALIEKRHGVHLTLENIPTDDPETYQFIGSGRTAGIFQLEGTGMTRYIMQMKPQSLDHVIAMVALFRPGPMEKIPTYIRRMHNEEQVTYQHEALEPIFKETYGIPIYQEQIMFAATRLAGYTGAEADDLRKAISKKNADALMRHQQKFILGAVAGGIEEGTAGKIFEEWENFARYGFNKSHAATYGVIAVQTAYLKAHFTAEYMAALLSASKNETSKVAGYVADCRMMGFNMLPPDVNHSEWDFTLEDNPGGKTDLRFGLGAVKNVGQGAIEIILKSRPEGDFKDLNDFSRRVDLRSVGKRALECLIRVGALDGFGARKSLLLALDNLVQVSASHFRAMETGQLSIFGTVEGVEDGIILPELGDFDHREQLEWEKELIGFYVSDHPLSPYMAQLKNRVTHLSGQMGDAEPKEKMRVAGLLTRFRKIQTRDGKDMGFATLEDIQGSIELVIFPRTWERVHRLLVVDKVLLAEGKVDAASGDPKLLVDNLSEVTLQAGAGALESRLDLVAEDETLLSEMPEFDPTPNAGAEFEPPGAWMMEELTSSAAAGTNPTLQVETPPAVVTISPSPTQESSPAQREKQLLPGRVENEVQVAFLVRPDQPGDFLLSNSEKPHSRRVTIILRASEDKARDNRCLSHIFGMLRSSPGKDVFSFMVFEGGHRYLLEFPNDTTGINDLLLRMLEDVVGRENIQVETVRLQ